MFDNHKLGAYILYLRKQRRMTQSQLAELLGISPQAVSNWERGESMPDIALLGAVARSLGTTVDKMLAAAENYDAADEVTADETPDDELTRLKIELEETKRKAAEAEEKAAGAKTKNRIHIRIPSWHEVSEKLPDFGTMADGAVELGKDVGERAKVVFDAAQEFTRKRVEQIEREIERHRREREEQRSKAACGRACDEGETDVDLALIISLAPFATEEGIAVMLEQLPAEDVSLFDLAAIGPFAESKSITALAERIIEARPWDNIADGLIAIAPFLDEEDVCKLVLNERNNFTAAQIANLAPHMDEDDIAALVLSDRFAVNLSQIAVLAPFVSEEVIDSLILKAAQRKKAAVKAEQAPDEDDAIEPPERI